MDEIQGEIWDALCNLDGETVARLFTNYYGNQLLTDDFREFMEEEGNMKIKNGNETVYEIITNHDFTLDEAIAFAGEYSNDAAINGEPEVTINGKKYYYEGLSLEW